MKIQFDHNHVLPPHLGTPTDVMGNSPYKLDIFDFTQFFGTSKKRIELIRNLILFRLELTQNTDLKGHQWIDGSFVENIEKSEGRDPNDIDVVTFYSGANEKDISFIFNEFKEFYNNKESKTNYNIDHYCLDVTADPFYVLEYVRYWTQLFSHNRNRIWKGIVQLELCTPNSDKKTLDYLNTL